jgi:hypothetical protein
MTVTAGPDLAAPPARPSLARRLWRAPLWAHAAVLAVFLLVLLPVMSPQASFTQDEGAYALQARSLAHGSWAYEYKAAPLDPHGRWFPVVLSSTDGSRFYTYAKHPLYPVLLGWAAAAAGTALGLHLVPLLGAAAAAVAAWLLAGEVDPSLSRPAFWVAAASPVLVNGMLLWAHAPSAAAAGFALVAAARMVRRGPTLPTVALAGLAVAAGVLLRSEGVLFAGALAAATAVVQLRRVGARAAIAGVAVVAAPAVVAAVAERAWIRAIVGSRVNDLAVRADAGHTTAFLPGRLTGAVHSLLQAHDSAPAAGLPVLAALGLVAGLAALALRRWGDRSRRDLAIAAAGVVLLYAIRFALHPTEAVTGLFAAWPLSVLGLLLLRRRDRDATVDLCLVSLSLFAAVVLLTEYPGGGGLEWGGRFFSPAVVPLAVVATASLAGRLRSVPAAARRSATAAVVVLATAPAAFGLLTVGAARADQGRFIAAAARHPATVTVTTVDVYPRLAWRTHDRLNWMLTDDAGLPDLLGTLRSAGVGDVVVVTRRDVRPADLSAYPRVDVVHEPVFDDVGAVMLRLQAGG